MLRLLALVGILAVTTGALSTPYWVAWEGNDYPENEGWYRDLWGPEPIRTLQDGMMTLDTRETVALWDTYFMLRSLDPGPGEEFVLQWRVRVDEVPGDPDQVDPGVWFHSDNQRTVGLLMGIDHIETVDFITMAEFEPCVFHTFEFRSNDMVSFRLFVDGIQRYEGQTRPGYYRSEIGWGDVVYGGSSLATWDYLRYGVVPEPSASVVMVTGMLLLRVIRGQRARAG